MADKEDRAFTSESLYGIGSEYVYAGALSFMRRNYSRDLDGVDIVVADEDEVNALLGTTAFDDTLHALDAYDNLFAMTRSEKGSVIVHGDTKVVQAADRVDSVVDTTGAGDAYCAGFLYGWANDWPLDECARLGTHCGTQVIQQIGARIEPGLLDSYT